MRIVSLAPSITETLFALGLGNRVVGVSTYCHYPPQAEKTEKIGSYPEANMERIVSLKPDVVLLLKEHEKQKIFLNRFGIHTMTIKANTCAEICSSFAIIGRLCNAQHAADSLISQFDSVVHKSMQKEPRPSILLCVGRDNPGSGNVTSVFAAGRFTFYNDLLEAAGARNAFPDSLPAYSRLSEEGILSLAPDIIIDVAPAMGNYSCSTLVADWKKVPRLSAAQKGNVHCLSSDYATIPGPRAILMVRDLRNIIDEYRQGQIHGR